MCNLYLNLITYRAGAGILVFVILDAKLPQQNQNDRIETYDHKIHDFIIKDYRRNNNV